jgi:hypothetical protein
VPLAGLELVDERRELADGRRLEELQDRELDLERVAISEAT